MRRGRRTSDRLRHTSSRWLRRITSRPHRGRTRSTPGKTTANPTRRGTRRPQHHGGASPPMCVRHLGNARKARPARAMTIGSWLASFMLDTSVAPPPRNAGRRQRGTNRADCSLGRRESRAGRRRGQRSAVDPCGTVAPLTRLSPRLTPLQGSVRVIRVVAFTATCITYGAPTTDRAASIAALGTFRNRDPIRPGRQLDERRFAGSSRCVSWGCPRQTCRPQGWLSGTGSSSSRAMPSSASTSSPSARR